MLFIVKFIAQLSFKSILSKALPWIAAKFLGKSRTNVMIIGALLVLLICGGGDEWKVHTTIEELSRAKATIVELTLQNHDFKKAVDLQNNQVKKLENRAKAFQERLKQKEIEAQSIIKEKDREILLLSQEKPPEDCQGAVEWMLEKSQEDLQW